MAESAMITSGCVYKFDDLRRWYCQHVIFKINTYEDLNALEGVDQGTRTEDCESLKAELPTDECRCAAYLFHYVNEHERLVVKNLLINWVPDAAKEKEKALYEVTFDALRTHLEGVDVVMKATKKSEISPDLFESRCK